MGLFPIAFTTKWHISSILSLLRDLLKNYFICLKCRDTERQRQSEKLSIHCFSPQVIAIARAGPAGSQETGTPSVPCVTGAQPLGPFSATFPNAIEGSLIGSRAVRTRTGALMKCQHCRWWLNALHHNSNPC